MSEYWERVVAPRAEVLRGLREIRAMLQLSEDTGAEPVDVGPPRSVEELQLRAMVLEGLVRRWLTWSTSAVIAPPEDLVARSKVELELEIG